MSDTAPKSWREKLFGGLKRTSEKLGENLGVLFAKPLDAQTLDEIEEALMVPARAAEVTAGTQHVLSIQVPKISISAQEGFTYPYGFATTSADLDLSVVRMAIMGALNWAADWYKPGKLAPQRVAHDIVSMTLHGLAGSGAGAQP